MEIVKMMLQNGVKNANNAINYQIIIAKSAMKCMKIASVILNMQR